MPVHPTWLDVLTDPVRLDLLRVLAESGTASAAELRQRAHVSDPTLRRHLEALEVLGLLRRLPGESNGLTPGRPATRFGLYAEARESVEELFRVLAKPLNGAGRRTA